MASPLALDALLAPPHATVRLVKQSSSERRQKLTEKALFAMQLLAVPSWVLRIDETSERILGGPSFESLGSTVEMGRWEGQITWEQGLSGPGSTSPTDDALPVLTLGIPNSKRGEELCYWRKTRMQGFIPSADGNLGTPIATPR